LDAWKAFYDSTAPASEPLPTPWEEKLSDVQALIALRLFRPDKMTAKVTKFVQKNFGDYFTSPPPFNLAAAFEDSQCCAALIFVLSTGSDPMSSVLTFAETKAMAGDKIGTISLGQGQGSIAEKMIKQAMVDGCWVVLQNCHLCTSWMPQLEYIMEEILTPEATHPDFRLWLTSYPSSAFPVSVLQNGVKMTNEPPNGLRANLMRSYASDPISDPQFFANTNKPARWEKMLFSLCFFHGLVQERRQFGPLGFNIAYGFDESDLRISIRQMQSFVNDYDELPLEALTYCVGQCNYGGRVTDDWDRRCLLSLLSIFFNEVVIDDDDYRFSPGGLYYAPPKGDVASYLAYLDSLPQIAEPEVFGMHSNADISKDQKETNMLFDGILCTLPRQNSAAGKGPNEVVDEMCSNILSDVAKPFDTEAVGMRYPVLYAESMNTVLLQECVRFNRLVKVVRTSLESIRKAIVGVVIMSEELEGIYNAILLGKVPTKWAKASYPSLKKLGGYVEDLVRRLHFLQRWIDGGKPAAYWLSGFYFTQAFLTGVRQNHARKHGIAIDLLVFDSVVTKTEAADVAGLATPPPVGCFVHGLFMEGMRWDRDAMQLGESLPKVLYDALPVMVLVPVLVAEHHVAATFACPVYKTTERKGVLATTGHSSNYVMQIDLPTDADQSHWINRGAALLCSLSD